MTKLGVRWGSTVVLWLTVLASAAAAAPADGPLLTAVRGGDAERVRALLAIGADPDASASDGGTALLWAAAAGDDTLTRMLLEAGAAAARPHCLQGAT